MCLLDNEVLPENVMSIAEQQFPELPTQTLPGNQPSDMVKATVELLDSTQTDCLLELLTVKKEQLVVEVKKAREYAITSNVDSKVCWGCLEGKQILNAIQQLRGQYQRAESLAVALVGEDEDKAYEITKQEWINKYRKTWQTMNDPGPMFTQGRMMKSKTWVAADEDRRSLKVFPFPTGRDYPCSLATHASINNPYSGHSDTLGKRCNNDKGRVGSYPADMRIFTHCRIKPLAGKQIPSITNRLKHGLPGTSNSGGPTYCNLMGCIRVHDPKQFVLLQSSNSITLGGPANAHLQMCGTQGQLFHYIEPISKNVLRVIHSPRQLGIFQNSAEKRNQLSRQVPGLIASDAHDTKNILDVLRGLQNGVSLQNGNQVKNRSQNDAAHAFEEKREKCFQYSKYMTGPLQDEEKFKRNHVIGIPKTITKHQLARSKECVRALYEKNTTLVFEYEENETIRSGPLCNIDNNTLIKPGQFLTSDQIKNYGGIPSTSHNKHIIHHNRKDTLQLFHFAKNGHQVMDNVTTIISGEGDLGNMMIRIRGGAGGPCGIQSVDPSRGDTRREGPTHHVGGNQNNPDRHNLALISLAFNRACVNVFMGNCYMGPWVVGHLRIYTMTQKEIRHEYQNFCNSLKNLYTIAKHKIPNELDLLDTELGKSKGTPTRQMENELMGIAGCCVWLTLGPLDPHILNKWMSSVSRDVGDNQDVRYTSNRMRDDNNTHASENKNREDACPHV